MDYIEKSLAPNEQIVVRGSWPKIYWIGAWAALIFLGIAIFGIFIFLRAWAIMSTTRFAVTDQRVVLKRGWLNTKTAELAVESVEGVHLTQSLWGKLFGYGHIVVTGTGDARIVFPPMAHPVAFRRAIEAGRSRTHEVHIAPDDIKTLREEPAGAPMQSRGEEELIEQEESRADQRRAARKAPRKRRSFVGLMD